MLKTAQPFDTAPSDEGVGGEITQLYGCEITFDSSAFGV